MARVRVISPQTGTVVEVDETSPLAKVWAPEAEKPKAPQRAAKK